jgi:hypothetical protein
MMEQGEFGDLGLVMELHYCQATDPLQRPASTD